MSEDIKARVLEKCKAYLDRKCHELKQEIEAINASAANETKSSMGDKYETGREMMMQERNKQYVQLDIMMKHRTQLEAIDSHKKMDAARSGALVTTDSGTFFISVPVGLIKDVDPAIFFISPAAPLSQAMAGKKKGEAFSFNQKNYRIVSID